MLNVHRTAKTYGVRPSELLEISDEWAAYCLDSAVSLFGNYIESKQLDKSFDLDDFLSEKKTDLEKKIPKAVLDVVVVNNKKGG